MYRISYAEIISDSSTEVREHEGLALDHAIELLTEAEKQGPNSDAAMQAMLYLQKLWGFLIRDLSNPGNELGEALRSNLVSIGLWIIKEADQIMHDKSRNFSGLIDVTRTIRDGLR